MCEAAQLILRYADNDIVHDYPIDRLGCGTHEAWIGKRGAAPNPVIFSYKNYRSVVTPLTFRNVEHIPVSPHWEHCDGNTLFEDKPAPAWPAIEASSLADASGGRIGHSNHVRGGQCRSRQPPHSVRIRHLQGAQRRTTGQTSLGLRAPCVGLGHRHCFLHDHLGGRHQGRRPRRLCWPLPRLHS